MKNNDYEKMINIEVPKDLDMFIHNGINKGKKNLKIKNYIIKSTTGILTTFAIFVGSINISPTFADSLKEMPIVGTLVQKFQWNESNVKGGKLTSNSKASITLNKEGEKEQLVLSFDSKDAGLYNATLEHFPETVTISLPGTEKVNILDEVERRKDASSYIKSIYSLSQDEGNTTYLQIEFDDTTDVNIEEYKDPGKIVINLKPGVFEGKDIYSVRTLSFKNEKDLDNLIKNIQPSQYRILRDEENGYFLELGQFDKEEYAVKLTEKLEKNTIIEERWTNNAPVAFFTEQDYLDDKKLDEYYKVLMNATDIEEILDYLDTNLKDSSKEVQETLLKGLTGYIKDDYDKYNLDKLNNYYNIVGKDI